MASRVVTVNDILDGHVALDLVGAQPGGLRAGVNFLIRHLAFPTPSPAILEKIGLRFGKPVTEYAAAGDIEVIRFAKGERMLEVIRPHLDRLVRARRHDLVGCVLNAPSQLLPGAVL